MEIATVPRPAYPTTETSVTGLSDELMNVVRAYAKQRCQPLRAIYDEAVSAMVERLDSDEEIIFVATIPGRKIRTRHIRLTPEVAAAMAEACGRARVHQSVFFLRSLRDYLSRRGIDAPE
ncbi:hypothetical protein IGS68_34320 (plasmid) [Skermanella sp. TT6]|uniref:CopG family transcriptional regulator n=1 Tax=Skermanella cutis TaxID=2775420 RepID=A0ABX7BHG3_9PROT|nr:hypothetical protein [Skermanella sp. TT6]QQP93802.1 hypothetical protein IGS68_34320 [Skermanella sp. TT6]